MGICTGSYERKFSNDCSTVYEDLCTVIVATKFVQDCETKVHSVCENHNGIWKNCVDQPRKECTERPVTKEIEKCAKVPRRSCRKVQKSAKGGMCSSGFHPTSLHPKTGHKV